MQKKLSRMGAHLGLVIDRPILEQLGIEEDTTLELTTDGESLMIRPARTRAQRFEQQAEAIMNRHDAMFRRLAE